MSNALKNVASVIISNAKAALKLGQAEGNAREAVALGLHAFMASFTGSLEDGAKAWGAEQRETITKKAGENADLLKSAKDIFKVRLSEARVMLDGLAAGNEVAARYFRFDAEGNHTPDGVTATEVLKACKAVKVEKVEGEKGEGEEVEQGGLTLDGFRAQLSTYLAHFAKTGELADALGIMAEVGQSVKVA